MNAYREPGAVPEYPKEEPVQKKAKPWYYQARKRGAASIAVAFLIGLAYAIIYDAAGLGPRPASAVLVYLSFTCFALVLGGVLYGFAQVLDGSNWS